MMEFNGSSFELFRCFQDGAVLQRNSDIKIWGFANAGTGITLRFMGNTYETAASDDGRFIFGVSTGDAGGPYEMTVSSAEMTVTLRDLMLGDVYFASGQSNMEMEIEGTLDLIGERIDSISYPDIREFRIPLQVEFGSKRRQYDSGRWTKAVGRDTLHMGALGYYFAEKIHNSEKVPVGIINCAIGGTPIEAHLPEELSDSCKAYDREYMDNVAQTEMSRVDKWYKELDEKDAGIDMAKPGKCPIYANPDYDDSEWDMMEVPSGFKGTRFDNYTGSIWFRKEFDIPAGCNTDGALLRVGALIDADETYINGVPAGKTDYMYPPRRYMLPDGVLREGKNVIAVRIFVHRNTGGFVKGKRYCIQGKEYIYEGGYQGHAAMPGDYNLREGRWEIDLSGKWRCRKGASMRELPQFTFFQYKPAAIYNGMAYALKNYAVKAMLWYQGESNDCNADCYSRMLEKLIVCYREWFGESMPFLYVQLPQYEDPSDTVTKDSWAEIREQQRKVRNMDNTAMIVTMDIGESNDLHPQTKEAVAERMALAAERLIYGRDVIYEGPEPEKIIYDRHKKCVVIHFDKNVFLKNDGCFELCYESGKWFPAKAAIAPDGKRQGESCGISGQDGMNSSIVISDRDREDMVPEAVRYCYSNNPENPSIYGTTGLPASPFVESVHALC